jgi:hypothetical protein
MSEKAIEISEGLEKNDNQALWAQALTELNAEIAADEALTEEEKRFLLEEMDQLSDDEWTPINCVGEPVSETIIKSRGER